ncbi:unnamed protein product [Umbelopsis ramanniana]
MEKVICRCRQPRKNAIYSLWKWLYQPTMAFKKHLAAPSNKTYNTLKRRERLGSSSLSNRRILHFSGLSQLPPPTPGEAENFARLSVPWHPRLLDCKTVVYYGTEMSTRQKTCFGLHHVFGRAKTDPHASKEVKQQHHCSEHGFLLARFVSFLQYMCMQLM